MSNADDLQAATEIQKVLDTNSNLTTENRIKVLSQLNKDTDSDTTKRITQSMIDVANHTLHEEIFQLFVMDRAKKKKKLVSALSDAEILQLRLDFERKR